MARGKKKKDSRHKALLEDFDESKRKHMEYLANQLLKQDEKLQKLKEKKINKNFFDKF